MAESFDEWVKGVPIWPLRNHTAVKPMRWKDTMNAPEEPFGDGLILRRYTSHGQGYYSIFDGKRVVASMGPGHLAVDSAYRNQGIASKMIQMYLKEFPDYRPSSLDKRSLHVFEKAWQNIHHRSKKAFADNWISIPLGRLKEPFTKVAISVPELVSQTNSFSVKRRPGCTPQLTKSDPKQLYLQYNVKCHESYSDPNGHDVRVKFDVSKVQETQKANDLDVQLNCSCPAFLYWGAQWNLHQRDGLLGDPRPELVAPTQHLDLRSNFVICKHCKAVLERILPSVQHNMINIIREETVRKNKEKAKPTPEKLQKEQDAMKQRMEIKKIRQLKNKKIQEKLLEALRQREEKKNGEPEEEMGQPEEPTVVEREQPATTEPTPLTVETPKTEDISQIEPKPEEDMTSMVEQEEKKLQEEEHKKLKNQPHLHKGLPYETDTEKQEHGHDVPSNKDLVKVLKEKKEKKQNQKRTSLEASLLAAVVEGDNES